MKNIENIWEIILTNEMIWKYNVYIIKNGGYKIIDMLQLLGNCSNTSAYDYTAQDIDKIFNAIEAEVREAKKKFSKVDSKKSTRFTLD